MIALTVKTKLAENHVGVDVGGGEDGPLGAPDAEPYIGEWED